MKVPRNQKVALITGVSSGIGKALAQRLSAEGYRVYGTVRKPVATTHYTLLKMDVTDGDSVTKAVTSILAIEGRIDILINNAGFGYLGHFQAGTPEWDRKMVDVNCTAVVHLTHLFLPRMIERRHGYIMMLASAAAFQPIPYMSTYAATKAFDRFLGEALDAEVRQYGIRVSSLCPGPTKSEFGQVAGLNSSSLRRVQNVEPVIRTGLLDLAKGRPISYPPGSNAFFFFLERFLPRSLVTRALERGLRSAIPNRNL